LLLGVFVSIFGQFGDLVESLFKRSFGVKDSGSIMPGHGGILDRLDSVLFAGAVVYGYWQLINI
jgi:phosphatidate cytidylyltransferase